MNDKLNDVLAELADMVDESYSRKRDCSDEGGRNSARVVDPVSDPFPASDSDLAGVHRKRTFNLTLYSSGEMTLRVSCRSECRLKILASTIYSRLNVLAGKKIRTNNDSFNRKYVVRVQCRKDILGFLQRSNVMEYLLHSMQFYLVSVEPETISIRREYDHHSIRAGTLLELIERTADFANQIEETFPCEQDMEMDQ